MIHDAWVYVSGDQIFDVFGRDLSLGGALKGVSVGADETVHDVSNPRPTYRLKGPVLTSAFDMLICDAGPYGILPVSAQSAREEQTRSLDMEVIFRLLWPHEQVAVATWVPQLNVRIDALGTLGLDGLRRVDNLNGDGWLQMSIEGD